MEGLVIGLAAAFNFMVIIIKFKYKRYSDAFLDAFILICLTSMFSGTAAGMVIATVASFFSSIALLFLKPEVKSDFMKGLKDA